MATATILIVDDEPTNLHLLTGLLRPEFPVRAANSGEGALRVATSQPRPDVILPDVMMPAMDGYHVLARLRENLATRDIPVMFLTALGAAARQLGLQIECFDFPVALATLRELLRHAPERWRG